MSKDMAVKEELVGGIAGCGGGHHFLDGEGLFLSPYTEYGRNVNDKHFRAVVSPVTVSEIPFQQMYIQPLPVSSPLQGGG